MEKYTELKKIGRGALICQASEGNGEQLEVMGASEHKSFLKWDLTLIS